MTLHMEGFNPQRNEWFRIGEVMPHDPPGSMLNVREDGQREIILFTCAEDNSKSTIYRSGLGLDAEILGGKFREVIPDPTKLEVIRELIAGESHEMLIKSDNSLVPRQIRFTHRS